MMKDIEFIYLSQADVIATGINMQIALDAVEDALLLHYQDKAILPYKTVLDMGEREKGWIHNTLASVILTFPRLPSSEKKSADSPFPVDRVMWPAS